MMRSDPTVYPVAKGETMSPAIRVSSMADPILRAAGIVKDYALGRTTLRVLRGVDVEIQAGQFVAIVGSSGSGKSTLLHIMGALDIPQRGQVWFRGNAMFEPEVLRRFPDDDAVAVKLVSP